MKDMIKEVALSNAREYLTFKLGGRKGLDIEEIVGDDEIYTEIVNELSEQFVAFLAELSKRAEASCVAFQHEETGRTKSVAHDEADDFERLNQRWFKVGPLFTFTPIHDISEIENRVAEACAKAAESDMEPAMNWCSDVIPGKAIATQLRSGDWRKYK